MAEVGQLESEQDIEKKIEETRQKFKNEYVQESDKYDSRDVDRIQKDDALVEAYLTWRQYSICLISDLTESSIPKWMFETGAVFLHGYDKEGNKLFWFKVKLHTKDAKTIMDKKKYVAFWLERYAKREPGMPLTVVFDMADSGISNIDMDFVKYIINCFKVYYPKFLSKMIIVDMPWIMNEAISKLKFASKNEIQTFIDPEYLPFHMNGTDPFKYSYPPLPDDDFQTPICENGPIISEDDNESKEGESEGKELESSFSSEVAVKPKKVYFSEESQSSLKLDDNDKGDCRTKGARKPLTTFKGPLLHVSPAEELSFGTKESERKCLIILDNISKNQVAFKVRTTAPEKYRVKPSNSSCEPGASVDIVVSLHGGYQASLQDRFLVMAAEMEQNAGTGSPELAQFWKDVPKTKIMDHRLRCHVLESTKPILSYPSGCNNPLMRVMVCNARLEQKLDQCLWVQQVLIGLVLVVMMFSFLTLYHLPGAS
ncbi:unnamed protein product [Coregonus sp. 'balchen']|nr:unnamed protein product [Coregonus sp. 'balchen']